MQEEVLKEEEKRKEKEKITDKQQKKRVFNVNEEEVQQVKSFRRRLQREM